MKDAIKSLLTFRWSPGQDTLVAFATALPMIPIYYIGSHDRGDSDACFAIPRNTFPILRTLRSRIGADLPASHVVARHDTDGFQQRLEPLVTAVCS
jgi:hypothetical protein